MTQLFTSRPVEVEIKVLESLLTEAEQQLLARERNMIVKELLSWLDSSEIRQIRASKFEDLSKFSDLCQSIQNEYELWIEGHQVTEIWRHSDFASNFHPAHPENFSFSCVEALWTELHARKTGWLQ